jgi:hypothetical protein
MSTVFLNDAFLNDAPGFPFMTFKTPYIILDKFMVIS